MMYPLQVNYGTTFVRTADTSTIVIMSIVIGAVVIFLIIAGAATNKKSSGKKGGNAKFRKSTFRRRAAKLGLSKTHVKALEFIAERYKVRNPYALLSNSAQLDSFLRKAVQGIDDQVSTDEAKEAQKLTLYRVKQIIERNSQKSASYSTSRQLKTNQKIAISVNDGERYQSRIVSVLKDNIAIEVPIGDSGNQVRWQKWSPVKMFFWRANGEGYSFVSKISGYNTMKGVPSAFIQHSNKILKSKQRRYRRKALDRPCYFYPVRILTSGSGRNQTKKAFVETKRNSLGTVIEISAGGCSVRASRVLQKGSLIKLDFETVRGSPVSLYGKVINTRKEDTMGYIMHIMFTRVSKKNINRINEFIYEYSGVG
ncbi:MAG: PilZ domain-containing protein [Spirochaetales bacterium]|jgi:c-di-GMP-binding flagellar brake protein YcgR|nr:PilZ domain-containing protein [Spirochaetales bacterium]